VPGFVQLRLPRRDDAAYLGGCRETGPLACTFPKVTDVTVVGVRGHLVAVGAHAGGVSLGNDLRIARPLTRELRGGRRILLVEDSASPI
jgi:hypothetical protein